MTGTIYALAGPEGIRYVGQTRRTPEKRYRCHAYDAKRGRDLWVYRWWRTLPEPPRLIVLERCAVEHLNEREAAWIRKLREAGVDLCNLTSGGDCPESVSQETRAKLSASLKGRPSPTRGMKMSAETRAKLSAIHRGRTRTKSQKAAISLALKASPKAAAARQRAQQSNKGRKRSPEARARMAAAQARRYANTTLEQRQQLTLAARIASGRA